MMTARLSTDRTLITVYPHPLYPDTTVVALDGQPLLRILAVDSATLRDALLDLESERAAAIDDGTDFAELEQQSRDEMAPAGSR